MQFGAGTWVLKRQLMTALAALRWASWALMAPAKAMSSPWRPRRQALVNMLNSISAMLSQLACLGVWWNSTRPPGTLYRRRLQSIPGFEPPAAYS